MSQKLTVLFFLICSSINNAQTIDSTRVVIEDGYIEKMNNKIGIDVSFNNNYETFKLKTPTDNFEFYPNTPTNVRLNVNYRFISFGFQFSPDFIPGNGDDDEKGKTKSFALGTSVILKHLFFDVSYSKVRGYYLNNSEDFPDSWSSGNPYLKIPDLHYSGFSMTTGYFNNSRFSFKNLTSQTERQLKSAGSFIPVFNLRVYKIEDKSDGASSQKSNNIEASIGPGYAYTFVHKEKFYLSLGLAGSIGYLNTKLTTRFTDGNIVSNQDNTIYRWDGKTGIGYNGDRFYTGLYANISGTTYNQENTTAQNFETRVNYHLFFGIRLDAPKYLSDKTTKIEAKFK